MRKLIFTFVLLFSPLTANASETQSNVNLVKQCLSKNSHRPEKCVGTIADKCSDGEMACSLYEAEAWNVILNEKYKAALKENDIKDIERRWLKLKNDKCMLLSKQEDGSLEKQIYAECDLLESANQVIYLMQFEGVN